MRIFLHYFTASLLLLALAMPGAFAYDFSAVCSSGQTLYYNITSSTEPYTVEITCEQSSGYYSNAPTGNLTIPSSVTYNGRTYSVTSIGASAFPSCRGLTSVTIPSSVTSIGISAFKSCSGLMAVNYNAINCTSMGSPYYPVFQNCNANATINIGEGVTTILDHAFEGLLWNGSLTIPNSVTSRALGLLHFLVAAD